MTISSGQTISHSDLNTEEGANRATLTAQAADKRAALVIRKSVLAHDNSAAKTLEAQVDFTPDDDYVLEMLHLYIEGAATNTVTLSLTTPDDATGEYLLNQTLSLAVAAGASARGATTYSSTTGTRIMLHKGIRYRIAFPCSGATVQTVVHALLMARLFRRRV